AGDTEIMNGDHVRVGEGRCGTGLTLKAFGCSRHVKEIVTNQLGGDPPIERGVESDVDRAHPAATDTALELITIDEETRGIDGDQPRTVGAAAHRSRIVAVPTHWTFFEALERCVRGDFASRQSHRDVLRNR